MKRRTVRRPGGKHLIGARKRLSTGQAVTVAPAAPRATTPRSALSKKWQRVSKAALLQVREDAAHLKTACVDPDLCMVLGMQDAPMRRFTDGFQNLHYLTECRRLGETGTNGFVFGMTFLRKEYKTFAVLKSNRRVGSDNLMYEYRVGLFLNTKLRQLPNFVATYAAFAYTSAASWQSMIAAHAQQTALSPDQVRSALRSVPFDMELGCRNNKDKRATQGVHVAILVQNLPNPVSLQDLLDKQAFRTDVSFVGNLLPVLFQVYFALASLKDEFTHYDLHADNVLLYEPSAGRHVEFVYHMRSGEPLRFQSRYIAKIIDYGRGFFKDTATGESSKQLQKLLPKTCPGIWSYAHDLRSQGLAGGQSAYRGPQTWRSDGGGGGGGVGYGMFAGGTMGSRVAGTAEFFIDSDNRNQSHDLRLLHETRARDA